MKLRSVTLDYFVPAAAGGGGDNAFHPALPHRQRAPVHRRDCHWLRSDAFFIAANGWHRQSRKLSTNWLSIGNLHVDFGLKLDALSLMMMLIVTGVGGAIHIYSFGYMREDRGFSRYFACLSLFTFSMLGIVLANNFIQLFIFWELVGVSSYLLIGFWFEKPSAADAAKKAFITNRLGDFGFLLGILMVWGVLGSLNFLARSN